MPRYFLELAYKGTAYSGFQSQKNANTIQAEVEKAFEVLQKQKVSLIGSSRTDAGVHADQNYFHFDFEETPHTQFVYKMNAILPADIVIKKLIPVLPVMHCRFDAISRAYKYYIYQTKNPFLSDRAHYYPYKLNLEKLEAAAELIKRYHDFTSFSKRNTQVKTFSCDIRESRWLVEGDDQLVYEVIANRFLRGMVKGLVATMLQVGREKISLDEFRKIIEARNCEAADFSVPSQGLFLKAVLYPSGFFKQGIEVED